MLLMSGAAPPGAPPPSANGAAAALVASGEGPRRSGPKPMADSTTPTTTPPNPHGNPARQPDGWPRPTVAPHWWQNLAPSASVALQAGQFIASSGWVWPLAAAVQIT